MSDFIDVKGQLVPDDNEGAGDPQRHPIDLDAVRKGDHWSFEWMAARTGLQGDDLRMRLLRLKAEIEARHPVTCKINNQGLYVLSDSEALTHNIKIFDWAKRQMGRRFTLSSQIDTDLLTANEAQLHLRSQIYQGRVLQAQRAATREFRRIEAGKEQPPTALPSG